ncbi:MAG: nitrilase-related carbon-nitrogen hydrolase [bacterium]
MRDIRVATVQFQHAPGDKRYNLDRVRHFSSGAAREKVEIIAFPETCLTGYWHVGKLSREAFEALAEPVLALDRSRRSCCVSRASTA